MSRYVGSFLNNKYYGFFFSAIKLFRRIKLITDRNMENFNSLIKAEFPYKDYD